MSDEQRIALAPYKHSEWNVGDLQTPILVQLSPPTLTRIGRIIAEAIEEQFPALRVCVVNVPMIGVQASVVSKEKIE